MRIYKPHAQAYLSAIARGANLNEAIDSFVSSCVQTEAIALPIARGAVSTATLRGLKRKITDPAHASSLLSKIQRHGQKLAGRTDVRAMSLRKRNRGLETYVRGVRTGMRRKETVR